MKNQSVRFLFSLQLILLQYEKSNVKRNHFIKEGNDVVDLSSSRDYGILLVGSRSQPEMTAKGWPKMPGGLIPVLGGIWEEPTPQRYSVTGGEGAPNYSVKVRVLVKHNLYVYKGDVTSTSPDWSSLGPHPLWTGSPPRPEALPTPIQTKEHSGKVPLPFMSTNPTLV